MFSYVHQGNGVVCLRLVWEAEYWQWRKTHTPEHVLETIRSIVRPKDNTSDSPYGIILLSTKENEELVILHHFEHTRVVKKPENSLWERKGNHELD